MQDYLSIGVYNSLHTMVPGTLGKVIGAAPSRARPLNGAKIYLMSDTPFEADAFTTLAQYWHMLNENTDWGIKNKFQ